MTESAPTTALHWPWTAAIALFVLVQILLALYSCLLYTSDAADEL